MRREPDPATLVAFLVSVTIAGGNAPAIRYVSCESCELDPFWAAATRFFRGAHLRSDRSRPRAGDAAGARLLGAVLFGVLQFGAGFGLVYWGLVSAPAGLGQVLLASVPLLTFGLALAQRQERFRWGSGGRCARGRGHGRRVWQRSRRERAARIDARDPRGGVCWAEALIVVKGFPRVHPAALNTVAMAVGAVVLLALTAIFDEAYALPSSASTWAAQTYLVVAGSVGVFWLYVFVLRGWTASAASYQLVLIPLVTVAVSAWLQDEPVTPAFAVGTFVVLIGVYIGALRRRGAD